jgi:hypothetical protein
MSRLTALRLRVLAPILVLLSVWLAGLQPRSAFARLAFQSSPVSPLASRTVTATARPTGIATPTLTRTPNLTKAPEPTSAPIATPAPAVPGFLPPPTLTSQDAAPGSLLPGGQPPLAAPPAAPPAAPSDRATPAPAAGQTAVPGLAQLIDEAVVALGYLWLCCGALGLAAAALILAWLARRSARRRGNPAA